MPDMKSLTVNGTKYNIKDATARTSIEALATVAKTGSYNDLSNKPTVDTALSNTSANAVQNKAIYAALNAQAQDLISLLNTKASTGVANTWTAAQTFGDTIEVVGEKISCAWFEGTSATPIRHCAHINATGNFTIDVTALFEQIPTFGCLIFTAYIQSSSSHSLSFTGQTITQYIGSASNCAITSNGLLLHVFCMRQGASNEVKAIFVQACKLSS